MIVYAYPEKHSPQTLNLEGDGEDFLVVSSKDLAWPNSVVGPSFDEGIEAVAEFLLSLKKGPVVPLSEEAVFAAALVDLRWFPQTVSCTHRRVQAQLLGDLAPRWWLPEENSLVDPPWWFKAPASDMSRGVGQVRCEAELQRVAEGCMAGAAENLGWLDQLGVENSRGIVQEHVDGPQYEVTGVVGGTENQQAWFEPLRQSWSGNRITQYTQAPELTEEMSELGAEVVRRLELSWCFVCIEARKKGSSWRVIEAHARPGDDPLEKGYPSPHHLKRGIALLNTWFSEPTQKSP